MVIWNGGQESERKQTWRCGQPVGWVLVDWSVFIEFRSTLPCGVGSETTAGAKFIARYSFAAARIPSRGEIKWFRGGIVVKKKTRVCFWRASMRATACHNKPCVIIPSMFYTWQDASRPGHLLGSHDIQWDDRKKRYLKYFMIRPESGAP